MEQSNHTHKVADLIARYNREMMDLYRQQQAASPLHPSPASPPAPAPAAPPPSWLDEQYPPPDIERDKAALAAAAAPSTPPAQESTPSADVDNVPTFPYTDSDLNGETPLPEDIPAPPAVGPRPYTGYLRVFVFTGNTAEPLPGARVTVTRREGDSDVLYGSVTTDQDGFTPVIPLPSVSPELTMRPDIPNPFIAYDIRVTAEGFTPAIYENVPVYGDNYVTQPAAMIPLLEGQDRDNPRMFSSQGPADL